MKTPFTIKHWEVPSTMAIGGFDVEDELSAVLALDLQKEIDMVILQELEAAAIIEQQKQEATLREEFPALKDAWEEYQVKLKLIEAGQLIKQQ